ncbi:MAG: energy-coupling factor transport system permease protein, partial [Actinomycetota bacterium]|nr:energy-coupling factor transport system permease protein [Actinomycetota bacterium]
MTDFHVLRCLPGTSPMRRLWAGTKLVTAGAIGVTVVARPTWPALGITAALLLLAAVAARFPPGALPRIPRWFFGLLLLGGLLDFTAGGDPSVHIGNTTIGFGGIEAWLRFTLLGVLMFGIAILLGATTPIAELPGAVDRLCTPARWLRLPVDEFVAAFTLVVRSFPLLLDEMRTLYAAWRLRRPTLPRDVRVVRELYDVLITAIASSLRRARDLARAIEARGGLGRVAPPPLRIGLGDLV